MTQFTFTWDAFVTADALAAVAAAAGSEMDGVVAEGLRPAVAAICAAAGGLPLVEEPLDEGGRTAVTLRLIGEGIGRALRELGASPPAGGYLRLPSPVAELGEEVVAFAPVDLNSAPAAALEALPALGPVLARRVVAERIARGPFTSLEELDERVEGIGPAKAAALRYRVTLDRPLAPLGRPPAAGLGSLGWLVERAPGITQGAKLQTALDMIATTCAADPHPATREPRARSWEETADEALIAADWVGILWGYDYFQALPELIRAAETSVDVCLFHIALPAPAHPTRVLLDELIAAHERGVAVRVLLDADRPQDPYLSSVINAPARDYLAAAGVPVRFDPVERLLHSKYLLLDGQTAVLGSHNWSAGSYFLFDDLSLVIRSAGLAGELAGRFESLWSG